MGSSASRRVAILGAGMIGEVHRRAAQLAGATVVGVMASSPERSRAVAADWGVEHAYADIDEVAAGDAEIVQGSAEQRRLATLPAGHAQGYAQCFEAYVADSYAAVDALSSKGGRPPWTPRKADTRGAGRSPTACPPLPTGCGPR